MELFRVSRYLQKKQVSRHPRTIFPPALPTLEAFPKHNRVKLSRHITEYMPDGSFVAALRAPSRAESTAAQTWFFTPILILLLEVFPLMCFQSLFTTSNKFSVLS